MDVFGNAIKTIKGVEPVTSISFDLNEEYMGYTTTKGVVQIVNLFNDVVSNSVIKQNINAIKLDPLYNPATGQFVCGLDSSCVLYSKGWFGLNSIVLSTDKVFSVDWFGKYLTWSTIKSTTVYNPLKQLIVGVVENESKQEVCWDDEKRFLVGCLQKVKVCFIVDLGEGKEGVEVKFTLTTDYIISGVAPFDNDILVLGYKNVDGTDEKGSPEIHILNTLGEELGNDLISMSGSNAKLKFQNAILKSDRMYYISSTEDIIIAKPRDHKDHFEFLFDTKEYSLAIEFLQSHKNLYSDSEHRVDLLKVGKVFIDELFEVKDFVKLCNGNYC
jgi:hypothetical protein